MNKCSYAHWILWNRDWYKIVQNVELKTEICQSVNFNFIYSCTVEQNEWIISSKQALYFSLKWFSNCILWFLRFAVSFMSMMSKNTGSHIIIFVTGILVDGRSCWDCRVPSQSRIWIHRLWFWGLGWRMRSELGYYGAASLCLIRWIIRAFIFKPKISFCCEMNSTADDWITM